MSTPSGARRRVALVVTVGFLNAFSAVIALLGAGIYCSERSSPPWC